jgi:hypothetical protein
MTVDNARSLVSLSGNGKVLAIAKHMDLSTEGYGHVEVFALNEDEWTQIGDTIQENLDNDDLTCLIGVVINNSINSLLSLIITCNNNNKSG